MSAVLEEPRPEAMNLAVVMRRLGDVPQERISLLAPIGDCTEERYLKLIERKVGLFELVDGTLVEKPMGMIESNLAFRLITLLGIYLRDHPIAAGFAPDGPARIEGQIRMPDVSIYLLSRFPGGRLPEGAILPVGPDLAVEVLSRSNTAGEMERKRREYFAGGTTLVWEVETELRLVRVYTAPEAFTVVNAPGVLHGEPVLPGLRIPLADLFPPAPPPQPAP